jgi:hypothetical protein
MTHHASTNEDRFACIEHIVHVRTSALEYLAAFHTLRRDASSAAGTRPALAGRLPPQQRGLWMDTIALDRDDIERYFERSGGPNASPTFGSEDRVTSPPVAASAVSSPPSLAAGDNFGGGLRSLAAGIKHARVAESWLERHVERWYSLGYGLANLLVLPAMAAGPSFIGAVYELLLELDHAASEGHSAKRALALRALKNDRESRGVAMLRPAANVAYVYNIAPPCAFGRPSYLRTIASLLSTLTLVYRKILDTEIAADPSAYSRFCKFDEFIDSHVINTVTKEMQYLARWKLAAEAQRAFDAVSITMAPMDVLMPATMPPAHTHHADPNTSAGGQHANTTATMASPGSNSGSGEAALEKKKSGWRSWFSGSSSKTPPPVRLGETPPRPLPSNILAPIHNRSDSLSTYDDATSSIATPMSSAGGRPSSSVAT